jgi:hypothetical protein
LHDTIRPSLYQRAALFRFVFPDMKLNDFRERLQDHISDIQLKKTDINKLYFKYDPQKRSLSDFAHIVGIHPLELWLAAYLYHHPNADYQAVFRRANQRGWTPTDGFFVPLENLNRTNESVSYLNKMLLIRFTGHGNDWGIHSRNWFPPTRQRSVVLQIDRKPWPNLWVSSSMKASTNPPS